jgi:hypothetical protein
MLPEYLIMSIELWADRSVMLVIWNKLPTNVSSFECNIVQICKDKEEAEVWFFGLEALISGSRMLKSRSDGRIDTVSDASSPIARARKSSPLTSPFGSCDSLHQVIGAEVT